MSKSLLKNSIFKTILTICNTIIPIIVGPYVLRILSTESYDVYTKFNADFQFFLVLGALGIYNYGVREISKIRYDKEKCSKFFSEMFIIGVVSNIVVALIYSGYALFSSASASEKILKLVFALQFISNVFNFEWLNEGREDYLFIAVKSIFVRVLYLALIFLLVKRTDDVLIYALLTIGSVVLNSLLSFIYVKKDVKFTLKGLTFKHHLKPLLFIFVIANVALLYTQLDKILLGNLVSEHSVAVYQIPHFISGIIYSVIISVVVVSLPRFSYVYANEGKERFLELYKKIYSAFSMLFLPCVIGMICLSREIVILYGSNKWLDCAVPLALFSVAQVFGALMYLLGDALLFVCGYEKNLVVFNAFGGVINLVADLILYAFNVFTAETAICSLTLSYIVASLLCYLFARKELDIKVKLIDKSFLIYLLISLLFIPIYIAFRFTIASVILRAGLTICACALLYFVLLILLKDKNAKALINKILKR